MDISEKCGPHSVTLPPADNRILTLQFLRSGRKFWPAGDALFGCRIGSAGAGSPGHMRRLDGQINWGIPAWIRPDFTVVWSLLLVLFDGCSGRVPAGNFRVAGRPFFTRSLARVGRFFVDF